MKPLLVLIVSMVVAVFSAAAQNVRVAVSPFLPEASREEFKKRVLQLLLRDAPVGSEIHVIDGFSLNTVCEVKIPELASDSPGSRTRQMRAPLTSLMKWLDHPLAPETLRDTARLQTPDVIRRVGKNAPAGTRVLMVGNPLHVSEAEPGFSFVAAGEADPVLRFRLPSHAYLRAPVRASPFGTDGLGSELKGCVVGWWNPCGASDLGSPLFRKRLANFWALYITLLGGGSTGIDTDPHEAFAGLLRTDLPVVEAELDPTQSVPEMRIETREPASLVVHTNRASATPLGGIIRAAAVSDIVLADYTASMGPHLEAAARHMALLPVEAGRRYLCIAYIDHDSTDRPAFLLSESNDPSEMAKALRALHPAGGASIPEALEDALHLASVEIEQRGIKKARIRIITDAPGHTRAECLNHYDTVEELTRLLQAGHEITLVVCGEGLDLDWVPSGVVVEPLKE